MWSHTPFQMARPTDQTREPLKINSGAHAMCGWDGTSESSVYLKEEVSISIARTRCAGHVLWINYIPMTKDSDSFDLDGVSPSIGVMATLLFSGQLLTAYLVSSHPFSTPLRWPTTFLFSLSLSDPHTTRATLLATKHHHLRLPVVRS